MIFDKNIKQNVFNYCNIDKLTVQSKKMREYKTNNDNINNQ